MKESELLGYVVRETTRQKIRVDALEVMRRAAQVARRCGEVAQDPSLKKAGEFIVNAIEAVLLPQQARFECLQQLTNVLIEASEAN